jgi:hypothetical protein
VLSGLKTLNPPSVESQHTQLVNSKISCQGCLVTKHMNPAPMHDNRCRRYVTFAIGVAGEVFALLLVGPTVDHVGRHNILAAGQLLGGAACLACALVAAGTSQAVLAGIGKLGCSGESKFDLKSTGHCNVVCSMQASCNSYLRCPVHHKDLQHCCDGHQSCRTM